ncbi:hypothetical protein FC654_20545 [Vibrio vulnificus]|nr:hypothetical protein [Vibrio vulnificus]
MVITANTSTHSGGASS